MQIRSQTSEDEGMALMVTYKSREESAFSKNKDIPICDCVKCKQTNKKQGKLCVTEQEKHWLLQRRVWTLLFNVILLQMKNVILRSK